MALLAVCAPATRRALWALHAAEPQATELVVEGIGGRLPGLLADLDDPSEPSSAARAALARR